MSERDAPSVNAPAEVTLRGVVAGVIFRASEGLFTVARLTALDGLEHTMLGDLGSLTVGEHVRVTGRWENHPTYGRRLRASNMVPELPSTKGGIRKLLASGMVEGIGDGLAKRIVDAFGSATFDVIIDHPERLREVGGIGAGRAKKLSEAFATKRAESEARTFLQAAGIGPALQARILKQYGDDTARIVRENPYKLAGDVIGVGFRTADRIGENVGIARDDPRRVTGAILHLLGEASDQGHTGLPREVLDAKAGALDVPADAVDRALPLLIASRSVIDDLGLLAPPALHRAEVRIAEAIARVVSEGVAPIAADVFAQSTVVDALAPLHAKQADAVRTLATSPLLVMTGGPGTGKTTTVRAIVTLAHAAQLTLALAAPTGRAARRMSEATGEPARTLHRLLEWNPRLGRFQRDSAAPIDADIVVVDEVSMLDVVLGSRLLDALAPGTRLVLVGDADQLPSVGPGTVLADLLATPAVPSIRLTEVFRQAAESAIVRGAHEVLRGELPSASPVRANGVSAPPAGELFVVPTDDVERAAQLLVEMVARRIPQAFGLDPVRDVQVLVPTHKGPLGTQALNARLQRELNANAPAPDPTRTWAPPVLGDKVMQLRNDYELEVWNGDIGRVTAVSGTTTTVSIDGREVPFANEARDGLALAYAATVHKSQGSEYDAVVIGLHTSHFVLLDRSLIYTAITRAKRLVVIVGHPRAIRLAVRNARTQGRFGTLRQRLERVTASGSDRPER